LTVLANPEPSLSLMIPADCNRIKDLAPLVGSLGREILSPDFKSDNDLILLEYIPIGKFTVVAMLIKSIF